jgi:hypothetical protein
MAEETTKLTMSVTASPASIKEVGQYFTKGVFHEVGTLCMWVIIAIAAISIFRHAFGLGIDDTDKNRWNRSGLRVYTDHKTGLQYLSDGKGGLILRQDRDGKPIIGK